jgi:multicomponent K+:H+ antiporter subunit G
MLDILVSVLILLGAAFTFIGSLGLVVLPNFYTRLHGPTKASTLGVGSLLIASTIYFSTQGEGLSLHEVLVAMFLLVAAPVSAHLLAKAALHQRVASRAAFAESPGGQDCEDRDGAGLDGRSSR